MPGDDSVMLCSPGISLPRDQCFRCEADAQRLYYAKLNVEVAPHPPLRIKKFRNFSFCWQSR